MRAPSLASARRHALPGRWVFVGHLCAQVLPPPDAHWPPDVPPGGPHGARDCVRVTFRGSDQRWGELLRDHVVRRCTAPATALQSASFLWTGHLTLLPSSAPYPSVLGAGLRFFPCGQGRGSPPGTARRAWAVGPPWCHPEGCRSQSRSQVSPLGAVWLSAPWNKAEAPARTLLCSSSSTAFHCRSLSADFPHAPGRPAGQRCPRQGQAGRGSRLCPGQGAWEAKP